MPPRTRKFPIYGDGMQVRDWLYVKDHCEAILAVLERGAVGGLQHRRSQQVPEPRHRPDDPRGPGQAGVADGHGRRSARATPAATPSTRSRSSANWAGRPASPSSRHCPWRSPGIGRKLSGCKGLGLRLPGLLRAAGTVRGVKLIPGGQAAVRVNSDLVPADPDPGGALRALLPFPPRDAAPLASPPPSSPAPGPRAGGSACCCSLGRDLAERLQLEQRP